MENLKSVYQVYVSAFAIELYDQDRLGISQGRFVCKQSNYVSILRFARNLALHRHLSLRNYAQVNT